MKTSRSRSCFGRDRQRASVLVTALIFSIILAMALVSYLQLSTNSLRMAHRTFFADALGNLAETGLEEAVYSFNQMGNSNDPTVISNAWQGWTVRNKIADIYMASMGANYTSAPTVSFSGGGGTGAAGTASIGTVEQYNGTTSYSLTAVVGVTLTNRGSNYTSSPMVTLTGGGGSGAVAIARLAATRTINFNNLDQNAQGTVKVWVAGFDGATNVPIIVSKATIQPYDGPAMEKYIKVILAKNGLLPKGVVAKYRINWNGHPLANSYKSSTTPGVPPFAAYNLATARSNTTVASLAGPTIDLSQGTVNGNVMTGPGVTVTGGTVNGERIGNFVANINLPAYPANAGGTGYYDLGSSANLPGQLPRPGDLTSGGGGGPAADGNYYYFVSNCVIGSTTIVQGTKVVIVGTNTRMVDGLMITPTTSPTPCGSATIYMDGPINLSGNDQVNTTSWAGALKIFTSTTSDCSFSGNSKFYGVLTAPNAALVGNGGGNDQSDLCGSFVVKSVTSNGHMSFHYDEGLNTMTSGKPWTLGLWKELESSDERAQYADKFNF